MGRLAAGHWWVLAPLFVGALAGLGAGCARVPPVVAPISDARTIYMVAVEFKGSVTVDQEPFPDVPLPGDRGYARVPPDANGRWQVEAYRWVPGTITVHQGDDVTLEILGINGMEHPVRVQGYEVAGVVRRGQVTRLHFVADRAGIFPLVCDVHHPSMQAHLVVLAR